jgi:hypothetical protein
MDKGFSYYNNIRVTDIELCNFVGLETYKGLHHLWPKLYVKVTCPMEANKDIIDDIETMLSNYDNLTGRQIKERLTKCYVTKEYNKNNPDIVSRLIESSEPMTIVGMTPLTFWVWTLWMFVMMILTTIILVIYIYPQTISCTMGYYDIKCMTYC